jgi:molybdopterin-guanine dinucleotide biosynthesis protein B
VIKHTHHNFDIDRPGKDSFRHRQAGAGEVLLASSFALGADERAARRSRAVAGRPSGPLFAV